MDMVREKFKIKRVVKYGDPLSPNLFNSLLENILWELGWENREIKIDGKCLNNLRCADNVALISQKPEELQKMANELCKVSRKAGLHITTPEKRYY